jgi:hypothetical protein
MATIYAKTPSLGGFYPAGIKALRFRREIIYAMMEGPKDRQVPKSIPPGKEFRELCVGWKGMWYGYSLDRSLTKKPTHHSQEGQNS